MRHTYIIHNTEVLLLVFGDFSTGHTVFMAAISIII